MLDLTPGQGSALSGFFTASGAVIAIILAQHFFKSRIADLKSAIKETESLVEQFRESMNEKLTAIDTDVSSLNEALAGVQASVAQTQAAIHESNQGDGEAVPIQPQGERSFKEELSGVWHDIIEHIEKIASAPSIDGRTRAKYARIDRRSYYDLFGSLSDDGRLQEFRRQADEAAQIWYANRRRNNVPAEDVGRLTFLRDVLMQIPVP